MAAKIVVATLLVVISMLAMKATTVDAQNCGPVVSKLSGCLPYLRSGSTVSQPPSACCGGVQSLYKQTLSSQPARRSACQCIKTNAKNLGLQEGRISSLPGLCGVNLGYSISASTNCQAIP